jgi:hypothetical protein
MALIGLPNPERLRGFVNSFLEGCAAYADNRDLSGFLDLLLRTPEFEASATSLLPCGFTDELWFEALQRSYPYDGEPTPDNVYSLLRVCAAFVRHLD